MIAIEPALVARLNADAGVAALVGARVYPMLLPQGVALPAIVYQVISAPRTHGSSGGAILTRPRVQLSCWAGSYKAAKELRAAVVASLDGYRAADGSWVARIDTDLDDYDEATGHYRVILDAMIVHS